MKWLTVARYGLAAILLPIAVVLSHRNVPMPLALIALGGLGSILAYRPGGVGLAALGLIFWGILTCFWSPYHDAMSWPPYLLALAALGILLSRPAAGRAETRTLMISILIAVVLLGFEAASGGLIRDLVPPEGRPDKDDVATARGITATLCLAPAGLFYLWQTGRRRVALALLLPLGLAAFSFDITANALAFIAGLGAAAVAARWPRFVLGALTVAGLAGLTLMPALALLLPPLETLAAWEAGPASWRMRLVAWKATGLGITDDLPHLLFGHGVESARVLGDTVGTYFIPGASAGHDAIPTHPHNVFLQIWYDLGLVGVGFTAATMLAGGRVLRRLSGPAAAAAAGLIAAVLVLAAVDASLWTLWRVAGPLLGAWGIAAVARHGTPAIASAPPSG